MTQTAPSWRTAAAAGGSQPGASAYPQPDRATGLLEVAFVNNMPDEAFAETEQRFLHLVATATVSRPTRVRRYWTPGVPRSGRVRRSLLADYRPLDDLYGQPPDAVIVTGTEPRCSDLRDEAYWPALADLIDWVASSVPGALLSCLASHAAAYVLDGIERQPLPTKVSGVYGQRPVPGHPLTTGLGTVGFPHSRLNDIPASTARAAGYDVLVESADIGWTAAVREHDDSFLLLLQGHPEYAPDSLLREYRRDVRRYIEGVRDTYPEIPVGYLDARGEAALGAFERAEGRRRGSMDAFPFELAATHIRTDWQAAAERLVSNWLAEVDRRASRAKRHDRA